MAIKGDRRTIGRREQRCSVGTTTKGCQQNGSYVGAETKRNTHPRVKHTLLWAKQGTLPRAKSALRCFESDSVSVEEHLDMRRHGATIIGTTTNTITTRERRQDLVIIKVTIVATGNAKRTATITTKRITTDAKATVIDTRNTTGG
jgi:hypothetical protein